ncbi:MAG: NUDIX hydrolase [Candidatus Kapabacteria bacterium]|nr:NUDIX hydrolase [Candidatus Kapabacteria bacterium]
MKYDKLSSKIIFENPYWKYRFDEYELPRGGQGEYHYVDSTGSTMIIPQINDDKYILCRQYRYLNSKSSIEFPGGGQKSLITSLENAGEELREETGYTADSLEFIGENNPFNGVTNEVCRVYLASGLTLTGTAPDETEEFELLELTSDEINDMIKTNEIWDGMTIAAWSMYYFSKLNYRK